MKENVRVVGEMPIKRARYKRVSREACISMIVFVF